MLCCSSGAWRAGAGGREGGAALQDPGGRAAAQHRPLVPQPVPHPILHVGIHCTHAYQWTLQHCHCQFPNSSEML